MRNTVIFKNKQKKNAQKKKAKKKVAQKIKISFSYHLNVVCLHVVLDYKLVKIDDYKSYKRNVRVYHIRI